MNSIALDFGVIQITWYSIMILSGVLFASIIINRESKKYNISSDFMTNLIFWVLLFGIIGARLYYCVFNFEYYSSNPGEIVKIWEGGLAIHGGIIFGLLFLIIYCKKYSVRLAKITDILVVGLFIAQALGRWGNFFNQEAHGGEVSREFLEEMLIIPKFVIDGMNIGGIYYHPTFYYESVACLIGFIILLIIRRFYKYLKVGQLTSLYLIIYGTTRFFIEGMRTDSLMYKDIRVAQVISILLFITGLFIFIKKQRSSKFDDLYREEYSDEIRF